MGRKPESVPLPVNGRNLGRFPGPVRDMAYGCQDRREVLVLSDQAGEVAAVVPADEYRRLLSADGGRARSDAGA